MSIESWISDLLSDENRDKHSRAMLDVLRVLVVNQGTSWRSELIQDLGLLQSFKGEPEPVDERGLDEALEGLEKGGLIKVEKRVMGMMDRPREDKLVSLTDLTATRIALSRDGVLSRYMHERARW